jgi:hypothetical protein
VRIVGIATGHVSVGQFGHQRTARTIPSKGTRRTRSQNPVGERKIKSDFITSMGFGKGLRALLRRPFMKLKGFSNEPTGAIILAGEVAPEGELNCIEKPHLG